MVYHCLFCEIAAKRSPTEIVYEDEEVVVFRNRLRWVPVMLLVVPRQHVTQQDLWRNLGHAGEVAIQMGEKLCPDGFRLLSNFGPDALQTQQHGHIHVLGGAWLGEYA
ncbi:MAG: HIT domain-containing protein [Dehalococcoidia bacterium]|nr:HIT domain-containing protein [Dehalococcoidia bacterium]